MEQANERLIHGRKCFFYSHFTPFKDHDNRRSRLYVDGFDTARNSEKQPVALGADEIAGLQW